MKTKKLAKKKKKKDGSAAGEFNSEFDFAIDDPYSSLSLDFGKAIESAAKGRVYLLHSCVRQLWLLL